MTAKLIYTAITSADGYVSDAAGEFDWSMPSEEVHAFINDLERPVGTYFLGRRMFEVMRVWETLEEPEPVMQDYAAIWRAADKIVFSATLQTADTERTSIRPTFDASDVRTLVESSDRDISIGGATIAATALREGLVDEIQQFVSPVIVGGGLRFLPENLKLDLELLDERRFENGVVYVKYRAVR